MSQDLIKTNIKIVGRNYPLKVTKDEQVIASSVEKKINAMLQELQQVYPDMDIQDCMSMALIKIGFEQQNDIPKEVIEKLQSVDNILSVID